MEQSQTESEQAPPRVWVVRAGKGGKSASDFEELGLVAIGFDPVGSVEGLSRDQIFETARTAFGSKGGGVGGQVYRFASRMQVGDLVAVPDGETRELLAGRVTGPYEYRFEAPVAHYKHVREVQWIGRRPRDLLPDRVLFSLGSLLTVFEPKSQSLLAGFLLTGEAPHPGQPEVEAEGGDDEASPTGAAEQQSRNEELIEKRVAQLGWSETQDVVAGVLAALGYQTEVSPAGADGGVDIRACRDPLFLHPPVIKVQVKAKPTTKTSPDEIRQLNGLLDPGAERGLFVSTGGFTGPAEMEGHQFGIQLWTLERIVQLLLDSYEKLDDELQALIPLRSIWVLDADSPGEDAD